MWSRNQNTYSRTYASQNTGADTPNRANSMPARSTAVWRLTADTIPMGMPIMSHRIPAPIASTIVTGNRLKISSRTGTKLDHEK